MSKPLVWLASYPRSGNTFLRSVLKLKQCFDMNSASIYRDDLMGLPAIETVAGHIEHGPGGVLDFDGQPLQLIKTHEAPFDSRPAIYVLRDGRDAVVSLYHFLHERRPLDVIAEGSTQFGSWAKHVTAWHPDSRPHTLFLRYEDLVNDLGRSIERIADYLKVAPLRTAMPGREELARLDGHWIRSETAPRATLEGEALERFWQVNGDVMRAYGYH
jgi:hypothetical protein